MRRKAALGCFVGAGVAALIGAAGATLTSVPAIHSQLGIDPDPYWNNRLLASLILGSTGLFFGAAMILLGAYLAASRDRGRAFGGSILLLASIVPQLVGIVAVPVLTPRDWTHTISHVISVALLTVGLLLGWPWSSRSDLVREPIGDR